MINLTADTIQFPAHMPGGMHPAILHFMLFAVIQRFLCELVQKVPFHLTESYSLYFILHLQDRAINQPLLHKLFPTTLHLQLFTHIAMLQ